MKKKSWKKGVPAKIIAVVAAAIAAVIGVTVYRNRH